jgi:DNA-binding PucR family transcriptional regulator
VRGSIRSYHTPSQPHSQNQGHAVFPQEMFASEMERALKVERAQHAFEIERALEAEQARQASEIERVLEGERARHKLQMDEVLAAQSQIMSRFSQMESLSHQSVSVPGVSHDNIVPDKNSAHHINVSSVDSRSGNN